MTLFISDVHLKGKDDARERAFLNFLDERIDSIDRLIIAGDLFDVWVGFSSVVYYRYLPVLSRLKRLSDRGVRIDYICGNHDFALGSFFKTYLKANIYEDHLIDTFGGNKVYVCHGDLVNRKDYGYRVLRWCFRGAVGRLFMRVLHPDFLWKFGCWASKLSLRKNHGLSESQIRSLYHEYAQRKAREVSADVVILGHNHIPDDVTFELSGGKKTRYINIGDWVEHASFVTHQSDQFSLEKFAFDR